MIEKEEKDEETEKRDERTYKDLNRILEKNRLFNKIKIPENRETSMIMKNLVQK